jgi:hypothetical protein
VDNIPESLNDHALHMHQPQEFQTSFSTILDYTNPFIASNICPRKNN